MTSYARKAKRFTLADINPLPLAVSAAAVMISSQAMALDFHGYARAGVGTNVEGGGQVCYGNGGPAAHRVGRLGDECDLYAEIGLGEELFSQDGVSFRIESTIAYGTYEALGGTQVASQGNSYQDDDGDASNPYAGGRMSVRELYVSSTGLLGDSTVWVGKAFGNRKDVHIMDFFYLMTSGFGAGFNGLTMGPGKFSANWTQSQAGSDFLAYPDLTADIEGGDTANSWARMNKLDLRYAVPLGAQTVEGILVYGKPTLTENQEDNDLFDDDSYLFMLEHTANIAGGFNKFVVAYGTNSFQNFRANFWGLDNANYLGEGDGLGIIDHGVIKLAKNINLAYALMYNDVSPDEDDGNTYFEAESLTVVVRPEYHWNNIMSTMLEIGYDDADISNDFRANNQQQDGDLMKFTIAQAWSAGPGFFSRPEIRLFASYYTGDRVIGERDNNEDGETDKADLFVGAQFEAWW